MSSETRQCQGGKAARARRGVACVAIVIVISCAGCSLFHWTDSRSGEDVKPRPSPDPWSMVVPSSGEVVSDSLLALLIIGHRYIFHRPKKRTNNGDPCVTS